MVCFNKGLIIWIIASKLSTLTNCENVINSYFYEVLLAAMVFFFQMIPLQFHLGKLLTYKLPVQHMCNLLLDKTPLQLLGFLLEQRTLPPSVPVVI